MNSPLPADMALYLALGLAALALVCGLLLIRSQRHLRAQLMAREAEIALREEEQAQRLQALTEQLGQLGAGEMGVARQLSRAQRELVDLRGRVDELESAQQRSAPYATAIRLAEQGAGVDGVMDACGLSEAEAELLLKLHSARDQAQPSHS